LELITIFNGVEKNMGRSVQKRILIILSILFMVQVSWAQNKDQTNADPRYIIDPETGKLSMSIRIWGEVKTPGVKLVPSDADLISILSYVGGPSNMAKLDNIRILRFNETEGEERVIIANVERFLETGDSKFIPKIYPNDTIIVKGTVWRILSTAIPYINLMVTLINGYYLYTRTTT
jgi:hypothetical protein